MNRLLAVIGELSVDSLDTKPPASFPAAGESRIPSHGSEAPAAAAKPGGSCGHQAAAAGVQ